MVFKMDLNELKERIKQIAVDSGAKLQRLISMKIPLKREKILIEILEQKAF